jgi:hypothetical protein
MTLPLAVRVLRRPVASSSPGTVSAPHCIRLLDAIDSCYCCADGFRLQRGVVTCASPHQLAPDIQQ